MGTFLYLDKRGVYSQVSSMDPQYGPIVLGSLYTAYTPFKALEAQLRGHSRDPGKDLRHVSYNRNS